MPGHFYKVTNFENKAIRTERNICNSNNSKSNNISNTQNSLPNQEEKTTQKNKGNHMDKQITRVSTVGSQ